MDKEKIIVEVGFKLEKTYEYYDKILKNKGFINNFNCHTRDIYYTNKSLNGMTENEMKNSCIRVRIIDGNLAIQKCEFDFQYNDLESVEKALCLKGYKKIFDTLKKDHHYTSELIDGTIQLQEIDRIGLLIYYDNSKYYDLMFEKQRRKLIDDLNLAGFNFQYTDLGLDKLRTLYYGEEKYSNNQNG